ncbi:MAG: MBL fold metallo-hydrolase [bacterium]|nr:MBL fold metallo-hydrolase [bacterium]
MSQRIEHAGVEGLRVGRIRSQLTTACILYRLGDTVIDTGPPNQWRRVRRFLKERRVERVIVTHHHEDHSGNLARVHRALDPQILSPPGSVEPLAAGFPLKPYQYLIWGRPRRVRAEAVPERLETGDGVTLIAVHAPGHSDDMTCYLEPERGYLFTGDLYIASKTRYLRADEDLSQQIDSLRRVLELDFDTVFCSHRGVVRAGKEALREKLDFLESLCQRVAHLRAEGRGIKEVTRMLLGREDLMALITGYHFSKRNLIAGCFEVGEGRE